MITQERMKNKRYNLKEGESFNDYCMRISSYKNVEDLSWADVSSVIFYNTQQTISASALRHRYLNYCSNKDSNESCGQIDSITFAIQKEKLKLHDEKLQINAIVRNYAREETIKEIAHDTALLLNNTFKLLPVKSSEASQGPEKFAILEISDWHFGLEIDNYWNTYNVDVAKRRISDLRDNVIRIIKKENITNLYVANLGDLISGRIHLTLRLNSRIDAVTQIMQVSELLAQFLADISAYVKIDYYDCLDNHSRIEPNKKDSWELESLARITPWYLKERLSEFNIEFHENTISKSIMTFKIGSHNIAGIHGHQDRPEKIVDNIILMTKVDYDLILTSHLHHFSADEKNMTVVVSNGSLMGTDQYAESLHLSATPSQNLIVVGDKNVTEVIYRIIVD